MRSDTNVVRPSFRRALPGVAAALCAFVAAHAAMIKVGKEVPWSQAMGFAAANGVLWFLAAPAAMMLGRALGAASGGAAARYRRTVARQLVIGAACAPSFGIIQGWVATAMELRWPSPPLASAFYYLDLNVAVLVLAAIALDVYAGRLALAEHARRHLALETRLLEVRHDLLTLQLQPHFLFNALNSVVDLVREAPSEAARVLHNLRTLFLASTRRSAHAAVSLADELEVVDAFIGVARARHTDALALSRTIDPAALGAVVPPLSLQPLIENAIQFALMSEQGARSVAIAASVGDGRLRVRVTNSCGVRDRPTPGLGIGLRNTRERLAHLFGADFSLELRVASGVAVATLDVPFMSARASVAHEDAVLDGAASDADAVSSEPSFGELPGARLRAALPATVLIAGFWMLAWVFWAFQMHFYRLARGVAGRPIFASSMADLVSAISWMALTPVALALGRRFPVTGERWPRALVLHVAGALASSVANIGLISAFFGFAALPTNNVLNQAVVNCAIYAFLVVWTHADRIARWFDERQTATRRLEAELARARWDATEMQLPPERIADELERIAALALIDAAEAEEEVLDMADALRRMLQDGDSRVPFKGSASLKDGTLIRQN